ncbi:Glycosyltransferase Family 22 protein [Mycena sanguinolenta]|uniref:Glycosyltransferase Family 22 protein n=1 Tax=Mycena sanguinolenta TaxID=230812 RepID=A0A8H6YPB2_9AGAR|nr:Glycosyltransferase Family 22 protein [Mycena sanguinolenta]
MNGETKNLSDGSAEALQALLHSMTPDATAEANGKLSQAAIEKLSAKLSELVGGEAGAPQRRNESGQLLNDEGLPIIEITEPATASESQPASGYLDEDAPAPLSALSGSERERRRHERDRILDLLEEEERVEHAREQAREEISEEQRHEILQKRRAAAEKESSRSKAAKDMQRKMGKALLRDMATSREESTPDPTLAVAQESKGTAANPTKTVTFANEVEVPGSLDTETSDWGDVVPGRLRAKGGPSLISNAQLDGTPMKINVVERVPGKPVGPQSDSDDESEPPDSPTVADSDEEGGGFESDEELAEEVDMDFARHQREIALEYNSRRAKMAETTSNALQSHFHDQDYTTSQNFGNQSSRKPAISHFQASRLTSSYNAATPSSSTSLDTNVVPASTAQTFQREIRMGKLDSDSRLVGADAGESGSDEEDYAAMQEITELLEKGEVYNLGPDGNYLHVVPPKSSAPSLPATQAPVPTPHGPPPSARKPSASKFKLAHSGRTRPAAMPSPDTSRSSTPTSHVSRSSPKLPTPVAESDSSMSPPTVSSTVLERSAPSTSTAFSSMVIDSPSFPESRQSRRPQQPPTVIRVADKPAKVSRFLAERM